MEDNDLTRSEQSNNTDKREKQRLLNRIVVETRLYEELNNRLLKKKRFFLCWALVVWALVAAGAWVSFSNFDALQASLTVENLMTVLLSGAVALGGILGFLFGRIRQKDILQNMENKVKEKQREIAALKRTAAQYNEKEE